MNDESLFAAALELPTGADRQAFLEMACAGDARQRRRVQNLLAADARDRGVLDRTQDAASLIGVDQPGSTLAAGQVFAGRFLLREKLGEGGMGEVWAADQAEPVRRRVALKVIRAGFCSDLLLARFGQEWQALALMDHPNIAKVLDAGVANVVRDSVAEDPPHSGGPHYGLPYFVMELLQGVPITEYCDQAGLPLRARLRLFLPVCHAVQHAHQRGLIHRDL